MDGVHKEKDLRTGLARWTGIRSLTNSESASFLKIQVPKDSMKTKLMPRERLFGLFRAIK